MSESERFLRIITLKPDQHFHRWKLLRFDCHSFQCLRVYMLTLEWWGLEGKQNKKLFYKCATYEMKKAPFQIPAVVLHSGVFNINDVLIQITPH